MIGNPITTKDSPLNESN